MNKLEQLVLGKLSEIHQKTGCSFNFHNVSIQLIDKTFHIEGIPSDGYGGKLIFKDPQMNEK